METPVIIALAIIGFVTIAFLLYYFSPKKKILRQLKKTTYSRISSLQNNKFAKIDGTASAIKEPLIAPLSKRKCVFYKIKIEKKVGSRKNSKWITIVNETEIQDFFVEQTGERLVVLPTKNPINYSDYLVTDKKTNSGTFNDPSTEFKALLDFYNIKSEGLFGLNKSIRYREAIVEVGERIVVAGYVKWSKLDNPVKGYNYASIASITSKGEQKITITDTPEALKPKFGTA